MLNYGARFLYLPGDVYCEGGITHIITEVNIWKAF